MRRNNFKFYLDFIPLAILVGYASFLIFEFITDKYAFMWQHIVGLIILAINIGLFFWRHQIAILALGLTLFLGLFGLLAFTHSITIGSFYLGKEDGFKLPIFYGQPIFLLWLLIHFITSGRYYVGIVTSKYWKQVFESLKSQEVI